MTTSFKFRSYGDAVSPFDFLEIDEMTAEMLEAKSIKEEYDAATKKFHVEPTIEFGFSSEFFAACEVANKATKAALLEAGYEKTATFIQTPIARLEWEYLGCKMSADPNDSDSDVSTFEIRIVK